MERVVLLLVSAFFVFAPRTDANKEPDRIITYADLPSPALYARCDKIFWACRADYPRCEIDRDQCVTWRNL